MKPNRSTAIAMWLLEHVIPSPSSGALARPAGANSPRAVTGVALARKDFFLGLLRRRD